MNLIWASVWNHGNQYLDVKGGIQEEETSSMRVPMQEYWGGPTRSSSEVTVIVMEQRGWVKRSKLRYNLKKEEILMKTKPYRIVCLMGAV